MSFEAEMSAKEELDAVVLDAVRKFERDTGAMVVKLEFEFRAEGMDISLGRSRGESPIVRVAVR